MFDLKFLGRGAAFYPAFGNTNAFFEMGEDLYFLDFGEAAFERVTRLFDLKSRICMRIMRAPWLH